MTKQEIAYAEQYLTANALAGGINRLLGDFDAPSENTTWSDVATLQELNRRLSEAFAMFDSPDPEQIIDPKDAFKPSTEKFGWGVSPASTRKN